MADTASGTRARAAEAPTAAAVSVVIITRNRRPELLATVDRLRALPERPPVIVVDNHSGDDTAAAVRARGDLTLVELPVNAGAAGRTAGVRAASTPYVAFSDDDSWWAPGALDEVVRLFEAHPRLGLLAARVLVGPAERLDPVCAEMARTPLGREPDLPGPSVLGFIACGAVVRRAAYLQVGGFDGRFGVGGEETVLSVDLASAGWGLAYVDQVVAHHHPSPVRDRERRAAVQARNELWSVWLRRPAGAVTRQAITRVPALVRTPGGRAGLLEAIRGLPHVRRDRRVVPRAVERQLRLLERPTSAAAPPAGTPADGPAPVAVSRS